MNRLQSNGVDLNTLRQAKRDLYARNNQTLKDNDAADAEIVAEYVAQNLLTNELSIRNVAQQDPSLGRRILNWLNSLLAKLGGKDAQDAAFVRRARDLYSAALQQTKGSFTQDTLNVKPIWPASGTTREINTGDSLGAGDPQNDRGATVSQDASGLTENMDAAEMRQWALDAYNAGQISEQTLDQILDDIDAQEEMDGSADSLEAELNRLNQEPAAQHSISELGSFNDLPIREQNALLRKKPIQLSRKDWAKVNSARMQRYSSLEDSDIPEIDIFYIAEYNKVNLGYSYVIRNYSEDSFSAISKKRIKPKIAEIADLEEQSYGRNEESQRTGENNVSKGSSERIGAGRSFNSGNRGELRENAGGVAAEGESNENLGHWKGNPNSGAGRGVNENADAQHSISPIVGQQADYGIGVVLDTPLFDGVKPRDWGKVLGNYVYQNLAGTELKVYDDAGNEETIYIAKTTDRVTKDGAKNSHKVIDKLARYRGDNIKALATVHLSELLQTAHQEKITTEHKHQWLDQNGWELRKTYIQDAKGNIYEAWLNIAKGSERNILYEINNVRLIDKVNNKRAAHGDVPSTNTGRGSHIKSSSSDEIVSETSGDVNGQHSISAPAERQSIIRDLRSILDRGGDPNELRRYVTQLEQGSQTADQTASVSGREGTEAQRILQAARDRGIGVEEYLEQNWERYDVDGQWNDAARQALELEQEQSRRQHSISAPVNRMTDADIQAVQNIGRISVNQFSAADIQATKRFAQQYWKEMGVKSPFFRAWFGDWRANDQTPVQIATKKGNTRGVQKNSDTGWAIQVSGVVFAESQHFAKRNTDAIPYLPYINDIVEKAILLDSYGIESGKAKSSNSLLIHSLYVVADIGGGPEVLKLYVEEMNDPNSADTKKRAYQLQNIEKASAVNGGVQGNAHSSLAYTANAISTVADLFAAVKQKDSNFNPKPASKVINNDGTPMVVYHGTSDDFTEFKHSELADREGSFFFAQNKEDAEAYSGTGKVMEVFVNLQNPIDYNNMPTEIYKMKTKKDQVAALRNLGYDGWMCDMDTGWGEISAFNSNQIKSATDNIGIFDGTDPDIRHSISEAPGTEVAQDTADDFTVENEADDVRSVLPKKARDYLKRTERTLLNGISRNLGVPWFAQREYLQPMVEEISNEYLKNGTVSKETIDRLFDTAYDQGVVVDREFYDQYKEVKDYLRTTAVTISESHKEDIADFGDFRKRNFGTLLNMAKSFQADKLIYKCPYRFVTTGFRQL